MPSSCKQQADRGSLSEPCVAPEKVPEELHDYG